MADSEANIDATLARRSLTLGAAALLAAFAALVLARRRRGRR